MVPEYEYQFLRMQVMFSSIRFLNTGNFSSYVPAPGNRIRFFLSTS
jgi:hypothetical protein